MEKSLPQAKSPALPNDIFTQKINGFTCSVHNQDRIVQICINGECKRNRLCCLQCVDQYHLEHKLISIKKFGFLYCKYGIGEQSIGELRNVDQYFESIQELINCKMNRMQANTQDEQKLIDSLNLVAQSNLWSSLIDQQKQKVSPEIMQKNVLEKFKQLQEMVFNQLNTQFHLFNENMIQVKNKIEQYVKHWDLGRKSQDHSNKKIDLKVSVSQKQSLHQQERIWKQKAKWKKAYIDDLMD